ncbi:Transcription factor GTP-binding domain [Arabidopsis thaliana x Arabidopsis arenosa]|uniref:Eukaryotic translation initiation factor 5B n=2 Tax=Arabidopsis TaxID=3701 RepID=A0A178WFX4_ARATH|nr:Transcription factor GTP-binding domain [Arabidopsis thaliana x Arabidopsis arenosa]OAP16455.1 hypothetical protein AXX17_AT1G22190 [Arabidopsis thaliana]
MDPRNSSAWGGDDGLPLISSMGGVESKNRCCVTDDDGSIGTKLCEKPKAEEIDFSARKKKLKSKKGGSVSFALLDVEDDKEEAEDGDDKNPSIRSDEVVGETSMSKKKKKDKSGKHGVCEEDDDADKILAQHGITTTFSTGPEAEIALAQPEQVASADGAVDKDGEEKTVESATAKKKKKKKDKDKKANASLAISSVEAKEDRQGKKDVKIKVAEKKVPKHVREKQETLARWKEAEERKKKEEEERLRKEEEERRIEEEREREAEEIRQKRKIRKMEKKQEGLILTAKQKRDAAKNEAFRKRVLTDAGSLLVADKNGDSSKRPIYGNKNKLACKKANDPASVQAKGDGETKENHAADEPCTLPDLVSVEDRRVGIIESVDTEETHESVDVSQENGDEEDVWDAKTNFTIKGDSDDEEEKPQPVFKKGLKDTASKAHDSVPGADRPTVKPGGSGKPKTAAKKAMPKVDDTTRPKDTSKKDEGLVLNELAKEVEENLRSPICCIMGHVDSGKTKLLDCIRGTNVQEGEAGGITQQIGATFFPAENIRERTKELQANAKLKVPGILVIDTPGHESFTNLRSRGSYLCDLAILVVDIMRGLEPQTIESLNLLRRRNVKFIVALNKVDRLYGWEKSKNAPIRKTMMQQTGDVVKEFKMRLNRVQNQFQEQGLNSMLYYKNREMGETISILPASAISGEGIPDLLLFLVQWAQKTMVEKLTYVDKVQILPNHIYNQRDPIILGVKVNDGILKVGTPICIVKRIENVRVFMDIGRVASIKNNNNMPVDYARKGQEVAIKIIASNPEEQKMFGRHFGVDDRLISHISSRSVDVIRTNYWNELSNDEKDLVLRLKRIFKIQ